jgi:cold shock CspA family protein
MNVEKRVTLAWLSEMLKSGLVLSYDPRQTKIAGVSRVEIAPAGQQHLLWSSTDWVYIESMMEVTPLRDREVHEEIRVLMESGLAARRRKAIRMFLRYLLHEDTLYSFVPDHTQYAGQHKLRTRLEQQMAQLAMPMRSAGSSRYGRPFGKVVKWDSDRHYGFIAPEGGLGMQVFVHSRDIDDEDTHALAPGTMVEYDVSVTDKGLKALNVVMIH